MLSLARSTRRAVLCNGCGQAIGVSGHFPPSSVSCHPSSCSLFLLFFASFAPLPSPRHRLGPPPSPRLTPPPTPAPLPHPTPPVPHLAPPSRRFPLVIVVSPLLCIALIVSTLLLTYLTTPPPLHLTPPARLAPPPPCRFTLLHVVFLVVPPSSASLSYSFSHHYVALIVFVDLPVLALRLRVVRSL